MPKGVPRTVHERIVEAEFLASTYLGNSNEAWEKGDLTKRDRLDRLAQKWLDEANRLRGMGDDWQRRVRVPRSVS